MKIRNGFISNSSSSSFVLIADVDCPTNFENELIKEVFEKQCFSKKDTFNGKEVKVYKGWSCDGENSFYENEKLAEYCNDNNIDFWDYCDELYDQFRSYFDKNHSLYIYTGD